MVNCAIYPGSFDPPTNGHLDIIARATHLFPNVIVAITDNSNKNPTFSLQERLLMLREATKNMPSVTIDSFSGLLVDYLVEKKATVIIRGIRAVSDFEYEFQMALMNRRLNRNIETVFLMPDEAYTYLSSSLIKEIAILGGSTKGLVPLSVESFLVRLKIPVRSQKKRLGDILVDVGIITPGQLNQALAIQKETGEKLGTILARLEIVNEEVMLGFLGKQCGVSYISLEEFGEIPDFVISSVSKEIAREQMLIPISKDDKTLTVAMADPFNVFAVDDLKSITGLNVKVVIASENEIKAALDRYYNV